MNQEFRKFLSNQGLSRLQKGHPWVFRKDLRDSYKIPKDCHLAHLGEHWFAVSQIGNIALRRIGPTVRNWGYHWDGSHQAPDFFVTAETTRSREMNLFWKKVDDLLSQHWDFRKSVYPENSCFRWVFSENDGFPGLIFDVFSKTLVAQIQTPFVDYFWKDIQTILNDLFIQKTGQKPENWIVLKNHSFRSDEGLPLEEGKDFSSHAQIESWQGLQWKFQPGVGQKTGGYLDQGENHIVCKDWATRLNLKTCWDLFCHNGGYGIHLLKLPSTEVLFVDSSELALKTTSENIHLNKLDPSRSHILKADVFDFLRQDFGTLPSAFRQPDLIVLDPPGLAKKKNDRLSALRAFRDLNLKSMKVIKSGGLLVSCSCSQPISREDFFNILQESAHSARRSIQVLEVHGPSYDHPVKVEFPEGNYLQAWFLRVV
jgi:23S rRNA (cytosine1962-C5)-methyltransferase